MTKILVLDDDEDFALSLVTWIEQRTTWSASYALHADSAMTKLRSETFDALILDRNLSDISGRLSRWGDDLFRDLRSDAAFDKLAVVIVTAYGTPQNSAEMVRLGAFQYLTKPLPLDTFIPTLTAAMAWQRERALCRVLPTSDLAPEDVMDEIIAIVKAVRPMEDNRPRLILAAGLKSEQGGAILKELSSGRRSLLISGASEVRRVMSANSETLSLLVARVQGPDGATVAVLTMESKEPKAFDTVWISVIESFADAMSLSYKLESLKRQVVEQAWKSLNEAASEFRHAFNGRLQVMKTHAQRIASIDLAPLDAASGERLQDSSATINTTVDRLAAYVKRMTGLGEDLKLHPATVDLDQLITDCWRSVKSRAEELAVQFSREGTCMLVSADPMMLEESLFCLFSNAIDAIEDRQDSSGSGSQEEVRVTAERAAYGDTCISVRDTGIGFDATAKEKLFLPFYTTKTDRPLPRTPPSHQGIGLFTVRRAMRLHGGDVVADSSGYYQGASFTLRLPNLV